MNESHFPSGSPESSVGGPPLSRDEDPPQFGAVDIVEAFTALRHEWRGQTKESRTLAAQIEGAVARIQAVEARLAAGPERRAAESEQAEPSAATRKLVELLVDTEHQLSRATTALAHWEAARRAEEEARTAATAKAFSQLNALSRWFARPLWAVLAPSGVARGASTPESTDPALEGLQLVVGRLRRALGDHQIERIDTEGRAFDATTMHAIGTVAASAYPAGHVAEQLSPAYLWQGRVLRFAEVRVAE